MQSVEEAAKRKLITKHAHGSYSGRPTLLFNVATFGTSNADIN